jgi:hypothetical protein
MARREETKMAKMKKEDLTPGFEPVGEEIEGTLDEPIHVPTAPRTFTRSFIRRNEI